MDKKEKAKFLETMLKRFHTCRDNQTLLRQEALDDIKFKHGEQWSEAVKTERENEQRPMVTINRAGALINRVVNEMLQNRPSVKVRPVDSMTDPITADVIGGLIRHILNNGDSRTAFDNACDYMVSCGFGYFRIVTDYCNDKNDDQEIRIERIENPFSVYFPIHLITKPDYSDAPYCFIRKKISKEEFDRKWPEMAEKYETFLTGGNGDGDWITEDGLYIAEYFTVEYEESELYTLPDGSFSNVVPDGITPLKSRTISKPSVKWHLVTQFDTLEENEWIGDTIPVIPMLGQEININGRKYLISLMRYLKEPSKMFNFWYTAITEQISNAPKSPWLVAEGQIEDYKDEFWSQSNRKNLPYLPYKAVFENGALLPPPQRIQPAAIDQTLITALQISSDGLKDASGISDAAMGKPSNERTGKAIGMRASLSNVSTYHFLNNYQRAIRSLGKTLVKLIPKVYDTARSIRIVGEDMTDQVVTVNKLHPTEGNPETLYDVTVGQYDVVIDVGQSYDTRRQEMSDTLAMLMQTNPDMSTLFMDIFARVQDAPGAFEMSERAKRFLNQKYPGIIDDDKLGTSEAQLRSQLQSTVLDLQKYMQKSQMDDAQKSQMQEMIKTLDTALKSKDEEIQSKIHVAHVKADTEILKAKIDLMSQQIAHQHDMNKHILDTAVDLHTSGAGSPAQQGESGQPTGGQAEE